jgi:anaerobic magnesium-protoporphyrin IX monomethyl ester cyclase
LADVLLTHSYHLPYDSKQIRKMQPYPPLGTLYAASALRARGMSVAVFDSMLVEPAAHFAAALEMHRPRIVAVYEDDFNFLSKMCLTRMREVAAEIALAARSVGATLIVHGSDATDNPALFLKSGFHYVLCGESEETLADLCSSLLRSEDVGDVDGLVRLDETGNPMCSAVRLAKNRSWQALPAPSRDLVDLEPYRAAWMKAHGFFSTNMVSSRGCPYRCNWCAKPISGNKFHLRDAGEVAEEMLQLKKRAGVEHIWFGDDVFALNAAWAKQFANEVRARNASVPFKIQSRADLMSEETVDALRTAGCTEIWMGVESGSQAILNAMDKGVKLQTIVTARERLRLAGIRACYFLQFGYPGETWNELRQTVGFVRETRPDDIGISFSYPLPGTVFYERVQAELGSKRNWTDSDDLSVMFTASYTTEFYRAVREALHAEVDSWSVPIGDDAEVARIGKLWQRVYAMEPDSRNSDAHYVSCATGSRDETSELVSIRQLAPAVGA